MQQVIDPQPNPIPGLEIAPDLEEHEPGADLHARAIVIDGHNDLLMAVADGKTTILERAKVPPPARWMGLFGLPRDRMDGMYGLSAHASWFQAMGFYDIPRALEGGVTSQAFSVYLADRDLDRPLHRAMDMIAGLYSAQDESPDFWIVTRVEQIPRVKATGKTSGFLTFEGLEPLGYSLKHLRLFHELGLRMASLTHSRRNAFADGSGQFGGTVSGGLTHLGREAIKRMTDLGIVIDLAHMSLRGAWEIVELTDAPLAISHASHHQLAAETEPGLRSPRHLWERIARHGGVIGAIAFGRRSLADFVDGIDGIVHAVGIDHVGLGTDFFGVEHAPVDFDGLHRMPDVTAELLRRGYSDGDVCKILGENYLRVFREVWG